MQSQELLTRCTDGVKDSLSYDLDPDDMSVHSFSPTISEPLYFSTAIGTNTGSRDAATYRFVHDLRFLASLHAYLQHEPIQAATRAVRMPRAVQLRIDS